MRHLYNYLFMFLALVMSIYLGLRIAQPEIIGHWHVSQTIGTDDHQLKGIHHFNIYANGEIRLNETGDQRFFMAGTINRVFRQMDLGGGCWYVGANYKVSGNRMDLSGGGGDTPAWKVVAFRTEPGDCDAERDYFADLPLKIRLPQLAFDLFEELDSSYKDLSFFIGQKKEGVGVRMFADRYSEINDLDDLQDHIAHRAYKSADYYDEADRKILVYQDAEVEAKEHLGLLRKQFGEIDSLKGYYRVYGKVDAGELDFRYHWVPFCDK